MKTISSKMSEQTIKWIAVGIAFIYAVTFLERSAWNNTTEKENDAYKQEKEQYENTIQDLETKLYQHEINFIKRNAGIDTLSNDELDSTWAAIFK